MLNRQVIALVLLASLSANADVAEKCDKALGLCKALVAEQDTSIKMLKAHVSKQDERMADLQNTSIFSKWKEIGVVVIVIEILLHTVPR